MLNQQVKIIEEAKTVIIYANGTRFVFDRDKSFEQLKEMFQELQINEVTYEKK